MKKLSLYVFNIHHGQIWNIHMYEELSVANQMYKDKKKDNH